MGHVSDLRLQRELWGSRRRLEDGQDSRAEDGHENRAREMDMKHRWMWLLIGLLTAVGLVNCGREETTLSPTGTSPLLLTAVLISPMEVTQEVPLVASPAIPTPASLAFQELVLQAKQDLARRLSIQVDQIGLVEAKAVVWPDGSIGCPQPGVVYTQVQREGLLIRLRAGKRVYSYHSGGGRSLFLCDQATTEADLVSPLESESQ